jgi:hypothetical protein
MDPLTGLLKPDSLQWRYNGFELAGNVAKGMFFDYFLFVGPGGVAKLNFQQEAVLLGIGQFKSSFRINRVLSG